MEVFQIALAEQLLRQGWRTIFVLAGQPGGYFRSELQRLDLPHQVIRFPLTLRSAWRLGLQLRWHRPIAITTSYLSAFCPFLPVLKLLSGASRLIVADRSSGVASEKRGLKRALARIRSAVVSTYIDHVIAVSDYVSRRNIHGVHLPAAKIRTILNGVELEDSLTMERAGHNPPVVAFAGQLIPEKGVQTLLEAVNDLVAAGAPPFKVLIAGEGWQGGQLRRYCHEMALDCVEFLGQIDWVSRLFESADIVVVPSEWEEAFGFTVAEAMAAGACVLASDAGGIPEVVGRNGTAGVLFRRGDRADLKAKLVELLADPDRRRRIGAASRQRVDREFSLARMVRDYLRVYQELDTQTNPGPDVPSPCAPCLD